MASPILYVSPSQANVQVPFELAGQEQATVVISSSTGVSDSLTMGVSAINPAAFLEVPPPDLTRCFAGGTAYGGWPLPVAFNSDGTRNSCATPDRQLEGDHIS